jgi:hypothetical protein
MSASLKLFIVLPFLSLFTTKICIAQSSIHGMVTDNAGQPMAGASVSLHKAADSSLVKGSLTAKNGTYIFENIPPGNYHIISSFTGFKEAYSKIFQVKYNDNISMPLLQVSEKILDLATVSVAAKKPMFEQRIDRMVVNVANSITNTGSTALEVLMRSPGITVNQQDNSLSMNGKEGVVIMLNGRINRMPSEAMLQMLAGMSAANIEKIELITTPPANFDAEGNAGFINIIVKKNTQYGTNGSFTATAGYGIGGGPVTNSGLSFNHRKDKWNLYGDYSFMRFEPHVSGLFYRKVMNGSKSTENFMTTHRDDFRRNHDGRLGLDYELDDKTVIGVLVSGFSNMYGMKAVNNSNIFLNGSLDTTIIINNPERHPLDNYNLNFNVLHNFKNDQRLSVNIDYIWFKDANSLSYLNNFYDRNGSFLYNDKTRSSKTTPIHFWVATTDYSARLGKNVEMESGVKATISNFVNDVRVEKEIQNIWKVDKAFTSKFDLDESIIAGYASLNIKLTKKITSKAGLRYEYTNSNLGSETKKNIVDKHYGNWFPSIFLSHLINDRSSFNLSYNRRITRPTFNDMAPFVYFVDPNTIFAGNPALQPSIANTFKSDYLVNRFVFSLSYTKEKNTITIFSPTVDPITNKQTLAAENQKDKHVVALTVSLPFTIKSWWTMQNNVSGYWQKLNAIYKGDALGITQESFSVNSTQSFMLPKNFSFELNGAYESGGLFGIYKVSPTTSLNLGVQKKLGLNGGTLLFNVTDFSGPPHLKVDVNAPKQNLVVTGDIRFVVTTFKLTYTKKFGNLKLKENRNRTTGSEDEKNRVQAN